MLDQDTAEVTATESAQDDSSGHQALRIKRAWQRRVSPELEAEHAKSPRHVPAESRSSSIPPAKVRKELQARLESLRSGLSTLSREYASGDAEAVEDTMNVLNDEITDLLSISWLKTDAC